MVYRLRFRRVMALRHEDHRVVHGVGHHHRHQRTPPQEGSCRIPTTGGPPSSTASTRPRVPARKSTGTSLGSEGVGTWGWNDGRFTARSSGLPGR